MSLVERATHGALQCAQEGSVCCGCGLLEICLVLVFQQPALASRPGGTFSGQHNKGGCRRPGVPAHDAHARVANVALSRLWESSHVAAEDASLLNAYPGVVSKHACSAALRPRQASHAWLPACCTWQVGVGLGERLEPGPLRATAPCAPIPLRMLEHLPVRAQSLPAGCLAPLPGEAKAIATGSIYTVSPP